MAGGQIVDRDHKAVTHIKQDPPGEPDELDRSLPLLGQRRGEDEPKKNPHHNAQNSEKQQWVSTVGLNQPASPSCYLGSACRGVIAPRGCSHMISIALRLIAEEMPVVSLLVLFLLHHFNIILIISPRHCGSEFGRETQCKQEEPTMPPRSPWG